MTSNHLSGDLFEIDDGDLYNIAAIDDTEDDATEGSETVN